MIAFKSTPYDDEEEEDDEELSLLVENVRRCTTRPTTTTEDDGKEKKKRKSFVSTVRNQTYHCQMSGYQKQAIFLKQTKEAIYEENFQSYMGFRK